MSTASFEDPFVKVWFDEQDPSSVKEGNVFYKEWQEHGRHLTGRLEVVAQS